MTEEIKKTEELEGTELQDNDLEGVTGGAQIRAIINKDKKDDKKDDSVHVNFL